MIGNMGKNVKHEKKKEKHKEKFFFKETRKTINIKIGKIGKTRTKT